MSSEEAGALQALEAGGSQEARVLTGEASNTSTHKFEAFDPAHLHEYIYTNIDHIFALLEVQALNPEPRPTVGTAKLRRFLRRLATAALTP